MVKKDEGSKFESSFNQNYTSGEITGFLE